MNKFIDVNLKSNINVHVESLKKQHLYGSEASYILFTISLYDPCWQLLSVI